MDNNQFVGTISSIIYLVIAVAYLIAMWKVFVKAGKPGWGIFIPIYNFYLLLKIAGKSGWWMFLYLIPFVNIIIAIIVAVDTAKAFGKSTAFGIFGLWMFSFIGYMILGFGDSKYIGEQTVPSVNPPLQPQPQPQPAPTLPVPPPPPPVSVPTP
jgi:hypothetical protein